MIFYVLPLEDDSPNRPSLTKHPVGLSRGRVALQSVPAALPLKSPLNGSFINLRVLYSFPGFLCLLSSLKLYLSLDIFPLLLLLLCPSFAPSRLHPRFLCQLPHPLHLLSAHPAAAGPPSLLIIIITLSFFLSPCVRCQRWSCVHLRCSR